MVSNILNFCSYLGKLNPFWRAYFSQGLVNPPPPPPASHGSWQVLYLAVSTILAERLSYLHISDVKREKRVTVTEASGGGPVHRRVWSGRTYGELNAGKMAKGLNKTLGGGNSNVFLCSPLKLGKWSKLTNIFQMGWNHQLEIIGKYAPWKRTLTLEKITMFNKNISSHGCFLIVKFSFGGGVFFSWSISQPPMSVGLPEGTSFHLVLGIKRTLLCTTCGNLAAIYKLFAPWSGAWKGDNWKWIQIRTWQTAQKRAKETFQSWPCFCCFCSHSNIVIYLNVQSPNVQVWEWWVWVSNCAIASEQCSL